MYNVARCSSESPWIGYITLPAGHDAASYSRLVARLARETMCFPAYFNFVVTKPGRIYDRAELP